jgi:hypothetical protein
MNWWQWFLIGYGAVAFLAMLINAKTSGVCYDDGDRVTVGMVSLFSGLIWGPLAVFWLIGRLAP